MGLERGWDDRPVKSVLRQRLLKTIKEIVPQPLRYVGLPGNKAVFEKSLLEYCAVESMTLFDRERSVLDAASRELLLTLPLLKDCRIAEIVADIDRSDVFSNHKYNAVWLDYTGTLSAERLETISRASSALDRVGVISVTVARREQAIHQRAVLAAANVYSDLEKFLTINDEARVFSMLRAIEKGGDRHYYVEAQPYSDTQGGMMMVVATPLSEGAKRSRYWIRSPLTKKSI